MMVEYKLDVQDWPKPESRLAFLRRLEKVLMEMSEAGIIGSYSLSTPNNVTCIFKSEVKA